MSTNANAWAIVTRREMSVKLTEKSFIVSTVITMAMLVVGIVLMVVLEANSSAIKVAVTDATSEAIVRAVSTTDDPWAAEQHASSDEAIASVRDGKADLALLKTSAGYQAWVKELDNSATRHVTSLKVEIANAVTAENARAAGIDPAQLVKGADLQVSTTDGKAAAEQLVAYVTGVVFAIAFFMTALMFGMQIAASVVKEKESRVIEILTAAVPTKQLLLGKILGNAALALTQVALYLGIALVGISFTSLAPLLPNLATGAGWFLAFFVTGFLALSCLWAAAGAMATRYEDLQQTSTPLTMLLMVGYFAAFFAKGAIQVVLSYVPIISSILMPMRLLAGTAQWWEAVLALLANIAFMALGIWVGAALYRRGVLQTGGTMKWRQAFATAK